MRHPAELLKVLLVECPNLQVCSLRVYLPDHTLELTFLELLATPSAKLTHFTILGDKSFPQKNLTPFSLYQDSLTLDTLVAFLSQ